MQALKQKIKETTLFDDDDKIAILAAVDTYESADVTALEAIIDEYDAKHRAAISEYKKSVFGVLDDIVAKAKPADKKRLQNATATIRTGVNQLLQ